MLIAQNVQITVRVLSNVGECFAEHNFQTVVVLFRHFQSQRLHVIIHNCLSLAHTPATAPALVNVLAKLPAQSEFSADDATPIDSGFILCRATPSPVFASTVPRCLLSCIWMALLTDNKVALWNLPILLGCRN